MHLARNAPADLSCYGTKFDRGYAEAKTRSRAPKKALMNESLQFIVLSAQHEAFRFAHAFVGPEHLFLGLVKHLLSRDWPDSIPIMRAVRQQIRFAKDIITSESVKFYCVPSTPTAQGILDKVISRGGFADVEWPLFQKLSETPSIKSLPEKLRADVVRLLSIPNRK